MNIPDKYKRQWDALASHDPYWAVLSDPRKRQGGWDKAEFFRTGIAEIEALFADAKRLGIMPRLGVALDYGCGVGRLCRPLADAFERVIAVDISGAMLAEAQHASADARNIQFLQNDGESLGAIGSETVDFVYSNIVLQHCPRAGQRALIKEFCRVLRPGGTLVFQTPSRPNWRTVHGIAHGVLGNRVLNMVRRFKNGKAGVMEMHTLPRAEVARLLAENGMSLIETARYDAAGAGFVSFRYFAKKFEPIRESLGVDNFR